MTLVIDPKSQKGQVQLEAIGWAQDQMNAVLSQYFNNKYRLIKALKLEFRLRLDLQLNEKIKVVVSEVAPQTEERFDEAVTEAKNQTVFTVKPLIESIKNLPKVLGINELAPKEEKKYGTGKK